MVADATESSRYVNDAYNNLLADVPVKQQFVSLEFNQIECLKLIELIKRSAERTIQIETDINDQQLRVEQLLVGVQQDLNASQDRVATAEAEEQRIRVRADAHLRAAKDRIKEAEERARVAEEWLARIHEVIVSEFKQIHVD